MGIRMGERGPVGDGVSVGTIAMIVFFAVVVVFFIVDVLA